MGEKKSADVFKITLRNDYAFKRVFGTEENKAVLRDFLDCVLDIPTQDIAELELLDKEFHNDSLDDKTGILDVKLRLKNGTAIDIEIQNRWNDEFAQRTVFYWAKMYTENLQKGEVYTKLPKCITINIVGEGFKLNDLLHSEYRILERQLYMELSDELEIHFLNLAKAKDRQVPDSVIEANTKTERLVNWLRFIETDEKEVRAMLADNSPVMEQANETVDVMLQDPKARWLYENRMKYEHDKASWEHFGYTKGVEAGKREGEAIGLEKGAYHNKLQTASSMKALNYPLTDIQKITGLSEAEIAQL
ncbi:Rpn family recombination-promoting nuclease/putative transposase [Treponema sp. HNW]|uniref:Rpn family recombination-promoting nuclease/putative transposase n=1 Tax=Treponema sp. HNW TaxID=3116654 RepID=UPI003D0B8756